MSVTIGDLYDALAEIEELKSHMRDERRNPDYVRSGAMDKDQSLLDHLRNRIVLAEVERGDK